MLSPQNGFIRFGVEKTERETRMEDGEDQLGGNFFVVAPMMYSAWVSGKQKCLKAEHRAIGHGLA